MNKQAAYTKWFRANLKVPHKNASLYMRRLLESAFEAGHELGKSRYQAIYRAGFTAGRKITKPGS